MTPGFLLRTFFESSRMDHSFRKLQNEALLVNWMPSGNDFGSQYAAQSKPHLRLEVVVEIVPCIAFRTGNCTATVVNQSRHRRDPPAFDCLCMHAPHYATRKLR